MRSSFRAFVLSVTAALALASVVSAQGRPFATTLTGEAEVTAAGVPYQGDLDGTGTARITLNSGAREICWVIQVSGITLPASAAHIHVAPATTTGPVVVALSAPDATGSASGCVAVDPELIKAIRRNPASYYVNVHTSDYPAGALRGQLSK